MNPSGADAPGRDVRRSRVKRALVYTFATACLVWVFHNVDPRKLLATMLITNRRFVALATIGAIILAFWTTVCAERMPKPLLCINVGAGM
jgi:hypothetical protein